MRHLSKKALFHRILVYLQKYFIMGKILIEKELLDPVNGELVGPYFHVYSIKDDGTKTELYVEKSGDIRNALSRGEHYLDFEQIEIAYQENPNAFKSCIKSYRL